MWQCLAVDLQESTTVVNTIELLMLFNVFRNFAMKHWLVTNAGGSKVDFEVFFKSLEAGQRKVSVLIQFVNVVLIFFIGL